jgi:hypothetical protein
MGLIRKSFAGSLAVMSGGLSLGVVQFRSDTERVAYQTKLLRQEQERANEIARQGLLAAQKQNAQVQNEIALAKASNAQAVRVTEGHHHSSFPQATASTPLSIANALSRLHTLQNRGLLSAEEYSSKKSELLSSMQA